MTLETFLYIGIVIYSIILHEIAHGYTAYTFGDNTAKREGRLSLNPLPHLDPVGSVLLPLMAVVSGFGVFGWAKPVPIDPSYLNTKFKDILVSAAGILTNFLLCFIFLLIVKLDIAPIYNKLLLMAASVNLGLGIFNLLPFPPFDGLQILRAVFPKLKHKFIHFEYNPAAMITSILIAGYVFSLFFPAVLNFIFGLFFGQTN